MGRIAIWAILALLIIGFYRVYSLSLHPTQFLSGWFLLASFCALVLFNVRKKLPFLHLGTSTTWLRLHIAIGLLTVMLFSLHIDLRVPDGILEVTLSLVYLTVAASGILGVGLSRYFPKQLTARGNEVIFEQIPSLRKRLREKFEELVVRTASDPNSTTIADFSTRRLIATRLLPFFYGPKNFLWHLIGSNRTIQTLLTLLRSQDRYLDTHERQIAEEIRKLIQAKDDLDYHYAHQAMLKFWLFIHIPLTFSLLILSLVHAVLVGTFGASVL